MECSEMEKIQTMIGAATDSGFQIRYDSGYVLSVQWGRLVDATRAKWSDDHTCNDPSATAVEFCVIDPNGVWVDFGTPLGLKYVSRFPVDRLHRVMQYVMLGEMDDLWGYLQRWQDEEVADIASK